MSKRIVVECANCGIKTTIFFYSLLSDVNGTKHPRLFCMACKASERIKPELEK